MIRFTERQLAGTAALGSKFARRDEKKEELL